MKVEIYVNVFTVINGTIRVLTKNNQILHAPLINHNIDKTIADLIEIEDKQISDVIDNDCILKISYVSVIDKSKIKISDDWVDIKNVDNLLEDKEILINAIKTLRNKLVNTEDLKRVFPLEFTLPEIQRIYEQLLGIDIDRRNFRKKFIKLDLIEDTNKISDVSVGRPAKLYRFKDNIKNKNLF